MLVLPILFVIVSNQLSDGVIAEPRYIRLYSVYSSALNGVFCNVLRAPAKERRLIHKSGNIVRGGVRVAHSFDCLGGQPGGAGRCLHLYANESRDDWLN